MRLMSRLAFLLAVLVAVATGCDGSPMGTGILDLVRARTLWAEHGPRDYDFTLTQTCFCGFVGRARVAVRNGEAVSAADLETGEPLPLEALWIRTVESAFDAIQLFLDEEGERRIDVTFHEDLGYPVSGFLDIFQIADEELQFEIEDLGPAG